MKYNLRAKALYQERYQYLVQVCILQMLAYLIKIIIPYIHVHSRIIHNSQKVEATHVSMDG